MKHSAIALGVLIGCAVLAGNVTAATAVSGQQQRRSDLIVEIVEKWGGHVERAYSRPAASWSKDMVPLLMAVPVETLQRAANAGSFDEMNSTLLVKASAPAPALPRAGLKRPTVSGGSAPAVAAKAEDGTQALGDATTDLVYVPVTPCRIFDTRLVGDTIAANSVRNFDVLSITDFSTQGGAVGDCNGVGGVGGFAAAVINFTAVLPDAAGYITAYPFGAPQPLAATVNYVAGDIRGNLSVIKVDPTPATNDISIYTFAQTHVVGDIVGYFIRPQATALQCTTTFVTQTVAANDIFDIDIPDCPVSYAVTGAGCRTPGFNEASWAINGLFSNGPTAATYCSGQNVTAGTITVEGTAQCCRVPGR